MKAHCDQCIKYQKIYAVVRHDDSMKVRYLCATCQFNNKRRERLNQLKFRNKQMGRR